MMAPHLITIFIAVIFSCGSTEWISVLPKPIPGTMTAVVRQFAKIPDFHHEPSRIVGMTSWKHSLYVCTSTSGGRIYRVSPHGNVTLWFDVKEAMQRYHRRIVFHEKFHGGKSLFFFKIKLNCVIQNHGRGNFHIFMSIYSEIHLLTLMPLNILVPLPLVLVKA